MHDYVPLSVTGYSSNPDQAGVEPGWEVTCHISPKAMPVIESISESSGVNLSKVIGGFIYTHFEFVDSSIRSALTNGVMLEAHTWLTFYETQPLAMFLLVYSDDFTAFLLHENEGSMVRQELGKGASLLKLGWVDITLED